MNALQASNFGGNQAQQTSIAAGRMSDVSIQHNRLESLIHQISAETTSLEERIGCVLRPIPPASSKDSQLQAAPVPSVALAGSLSNIAEQAEKILSHIQSLRDRCEL